MHKKAWSPIDLSRQRKTLSLSLSNRRRRDSEDVETITVCLPPLFSSRLISVPPMFPVCVSRVTISISRVAPFLPRSPRRTWRERVSVARKRATRSVSDGRGNEGLTDAHRGNKSFRVCKHFCPPRNSKVRSSSPRFLSLARCYRRRREDISEKS